MKIVNIHEARTHLSRLLKQVEKGKEIVIARAGNPAAKLVACKPAAKPRKPGSMRGKIEIAPDFDELPDELKRAFGDPSYSG